MQIYMRLRAENGPNPALAALFEKLLAEEIAQAILISAKTPHGRIPMPTVITDPQQLSRIDPLAPVTPFNAARQAILMLRHPVRKRLTLVLRPCEIRALIELSKLKQCTLDDALIIGIECRGRMENRDFLQAVEKDPDSGLRFYEDENLLDKITPSCKVCTLFEPEQAAFKICAVGHRLTENIGLAPLNEEGTQILKRLGVSPGPEPESRAEKLEQMRKTRTANREALFAETAQALKPIQNLQKLLAHCLNCNNCRVACPVCYCKECVFATDVFIHEPETLWRRAEKRGVLKLPPETTMFHLTRMAHMGHACVGCGHCSSVCPSDIPVADIFQTVGAEIQHLYGYEPGRDPEAPIPGLFFEEPSGNQPAE